MQMVQNGVKWCKMVQKMQKVQTGVKWCKMMQNGAKSANSAESTKWCKIFVKYTLFAQYLHNICKIFAQFLYNICTILAQYCAQFWHKI